MGKDTTIFSELQENFLHNNSHKAINRIIFVMRSIRLRKHKICKPKKLGHIYSHVLHISRLGFKGLFLGRTDGKTQMVLDCALVGEEGKNADKPNGMTQARIKKRFTRKHDDKSPTRRRVDEYGTDKQTLLRDMITRAIKK